MGAAPWVHGAQRQAPARSEDRSQHRNQDATLASCYTNASATYITARPT